MVWSVRTLQIPLFSNSRKLSANGCQGLAKAWAFSHFTGTSQIINTDANVGSQTQTSSQEICGRLVLPLLRRQVTGANVLVFNVKSSCGTCQLIMSPPQKVRRTWTVRCRRKLENCWGGCSTGLDSYGIVICGPCNHPGRPEESNQYWFVRNWDLTFLIFEPWSRSDTRYNLGQNPMVSDTTTFRIVRMPVTRVF